MTRSRSLQPNFDTSQHLQNLSISSIPSRLKSRTSTTYCLDESKENNFTYSQENRPDAVQTIHTYTKADFSTKENRLFENDIVCDSPIRRATYSKIQESSPKRLYRVEESYRDESLSPLRDKNEDVSKSRVAFSKFDVNLPQSPDRMATVFEQQNEELLTPLRRATFIKVNSGFTPNDFGKAKSASPVPRCVSRTKNEILEWGASDDMCTDKYVVTPSNLLRSGTYTKLDSSLSPRHSNLQSPLPNSPHGFKKEQPRNSYLEDYTNKSRDLLRDVSQSPQILEEKLYLLGSFDDEVVKNRKEYERSPPESRYHTAQTSPRGSFPDNEEIFQESVMCQSHDESNMASGETFVCKNVHCNWNREPISSENIILKNIKNVCEETKLFDVEDVFEDRQHIQECGFDTFTDVMYTEDLVEEMYIVDTKIKIEEVVIERFEEVVEDFDSDPSERKRFVLEDVVQESVVYETQTEVEVVEETVIEEIVKISRQECFEFKEIQTPERWMPVHSTEPTKSNFTTGTTSSKPVVKRKLEMNEFTSIAGNEIRVKNRLHPVTSNAGNELGVVNKSHPITSIAGNEMGVVNKSHPITLIAGNEMGVVNKSHPMTSVAENEMEETDTLHPMTLNNTSASDEPVMVNTNCLGEEVMDMAGLDCQNKLNVNRADLDKDEQEGITDQVSFSPSTAINESFTHHDVLFKLQSVQMDLNQGRLSSTPLVKSHPSMSALFNQGMGNANLSAPSPIVRNSSNFSHRLDARKQFDIVKGEDELKDNKANDEAWNYRLEPLGPEQSNRRISNLTITKPKPDFLLESDNPYIIRETNAEDVGICESDDSVASIVKANGKGVIVPVEQLNRPK